MKRVLVIGCSGSGKTTLARKLAGRHDLAWTSMDALFWKPGWVKSSDAEFSALVESAIAGERWVLDGNYSRTMPMRLERADTVVWLDLPRTLCLWAVIKRAILNWGQTRTEMPAGCTEKIDLEFIKWIWNFNRTHRAKQVATLTQWLGCEPQRGASTSGDLSAPDGSPRRVCWITNRRQLGALHRVTQTEDTVLEVNRVSSSIAGRKAGRRPAPHG